MDTSRDLPSLPFVVWSDLPLHDVDVLIERLRAAEDGSTGAIPPRATEAAQTDLPFYGQTRLVRLSFGHGLAESTIYVLHGAEQTVRLDGRPEAFLGTYSAESPNLSPDTVADYVRFYFAFVRGPGRQPFVIIEHPDDVIDAPAAVSLLDVLEQGMWRGALGGQVQPLTVVDSDALDDGWVLAATVAYRGDLFATSLRVFGSGGIEMLDDKPLSAVTGALITIAGQPRLDVEFMDTERARHRLEVIDRQDPAAFLTRRELAERLASAGLLADAINAFQALARDQSVLIGSDHLDTIWSRRLLAYWLAWADRNEESVSVLREVLVSQTRARVTERELLTTRFRIAQRLQVLGRTEETIESLRSFVTDASRQLGYIDDLAIESLELWVQMRVDAGDGAVAEDLTDLVTRYEVADRFGAEASFWSRFTLAAWLTWADQAAEGLSVAAALCLDADALYGIDSAPAIEWLNWYAGLATSAGETSEALVAYRAVLERQRRGRPTDDEAMLATEAAIGALEAELEGDGQASAE